MTAAAKPVAEALAQGHGAWFGVEHVCPDGHETRLRWDERDVPRRWLVCRRCRFAVRLVTRWPRGEVMG